MADNKNRRNQFGRQSRSSHSGRSGRGGSRRARAARSSQPRRTATSAGQSDRRSTIQTDMSSTFKKPMSGQGVRIRQGSKPTLSGAIFGVFIGIILVLVSPYVLWKAEGQHTAKDFQSATQVDVSQVVDGYVTFQGTPTVDDPLVCLGEANCLYVNYSEEELGYVQEEQCGTVSQDAEILYETVLECDEDGTNCEQCYMVEREEWQATSTTTDYTTAKVGAYTVSFNSTALMFGTEKNINYSSDTTREVTDYFPIPTQLLVAGDSSNGVIDGAEASYVLSAYGFEETLGSLESRDATNKWIFRIISFLMLFIGFGMIFGPISYFGHLLGKIPIVGGLLKEGTGLIVSVVSFLLAVVVFAVAWLLIAVVKNIVVIIGLLALIIVGFVMMTKKNAAIDSPAGAKK